MGLALQNLIDATDGPSQPKPGPGPAQARPNPARHPGQQTRQPVMPITPIIAPFRTRPTMQKTPTRSKSQRPAGAPRGENQRAVLDMLAEDHRHVQELFEQFDDIDDEEERRGLVTTTCAELTVHAQLEEELFYPAIREELEAAQLVDEAQVEHGILKDLITQLEYTEPDDDLYAATFHVLAEYTNHHVREEEEEIFKQIREADLDLTMLAEEMRERRSELRVQHGLDEGGDEDEEDEEDEEDAGRTGVDDDDER